MPSISAIARDWNVSRPYVSRCVNHRGCPTSSLQEAREWRECYANTRAIITRQIEQERDSDSPEDCALIPLATAKDMAWRGYDFILDLVLELPEIASAQCNPSNPQLALDVLKSQCRGIFYAAGEVYTAWSKIGPHISIATDAE